MSGKTAPAQTPRYQMAQQLEFEPDNSCQSFHYHLVLQRAIQRNCDLLVCNLEIRPWSDRNPLRNSANIVLGIDTENSLTSPEREADKTEGQLTP